MRYSEDYHELSDDRLIRLTVLIPKWLREKIREKGYDENRTMTDIVTEAITKYIAGSGGDKTDGTK